MTGTYKPTSRAGSSAAQAGDALWDAMEQIKAQFDKKVGSRMGRGDVRAAVLVLLAEEPMHGYQIIRAIEERTDGRWKPSAGSVYPTLQLLADEGLVTAETTQDRKVYSLTEAGADEASTVTAPWAPAEPPKEGGSHFGGPVPKAAVELAQAATQVARTGTPEQQTEAAGVLDEARRKIYSILARD